MLGTVLQKRDFYAGALIAAVGAIVALDSSTYALGTLTHMGPGMFPLMLGIILAIVGILIIATAAVTPLTSDERILPEKPEWFAWGCILTGLVLFIVLGEFFGLVAGTFACVFVPALGDRNATWKGSAILAAGVAVFGALLFSYALKVPLPMFRFGF